MITLTQSRRESFPSRYLRKDVRRTIYRAIFDDKHSATIRPFGRPLRPDFDLKYATEVYQNFKANAAFAAETTTAIEAILKLKS